MINTQLLAMGTNEMIIIMLLLPLLLLPLIALIDIVKSTFKDPTNKIIWVLIVVLMPVIGTLLYFALGRNQKETKTHDYFTDLNAK